MTSRQQRVLRGGVAATVATLLAATSHTIAGGPAPAVLLIALMAALLTPVASVIAGPRASLPRLAAAVLASQVAFHAAFQLLGSPTGHHLAATAHVHTHGHLDPSMIAGAGAAPEGAGMYVAHAVAALLTTALLWRGERVVRAIAGAVIALLRRTHTPRAPHPAGRAPVRPTPSPAGAPAILLSSLSRRGPPAVVGA